MKTPNPPHSQVSALKARLAAKLGGPQNKPQTAQGAPVTAPAPAPAPPAPQATRRQLGGTLLSQSIAVALPDTPIPVLSPIRPPGRPSSIQLLDRARENPTRQELESRVETLTSDPSRKLATIQEKVSRYSWTELSAACGISLGMVSMMFGGLRSPSFNIGLSLALYLGLDPWDLCAYLNHRRDRYLTKTKQKRKRK